MNVVITSYSIHYTKLYETISVQDNCNLGFNNITDGKYIASKTVDSGTITVEEGTVEIVRGRITSYNVCYTKLLRRTLL